MIINLKRRRILRISVAVRDLAHESVPFVRCAAWGGVRNEGSITKDVSVGCERSSQICLRLHLDF